MYPGITYQRLDVPKALASRADCGQPRCRMWSLMDGLVVISQLGCRTRRPNVVYDDRWTEIFIKIAQTSFITGYCFTFGFPSEVEHALPLLVAFFLFLKKYSNF
jgi:hypothetical protein